MHYQKETKKINPPSLPLPLTPHPPQKKIFSFSSHFIFLHASVAKKKSTAGALFHPKDARPRNERATTHHPPQTLTTPHTFCSLCFLHLNTPHTDTHTHTWFPAANPSTVRPPTISLVGVCARARMKLCVSEVCVRERERGGEGGFEPSVCVAHQRDGRTHTSSFFFVPCFSRVHKKIETKCVCENPTPPLPSPPLPRPCPSMRAAPLPPPPSPVLCAALSHSSLFLCTQACVKKWRNEEDGDEAEEDEDEEEARKITPKKVPKAKYSSSIKNPPYDTTPPPPHTTSFHPLPTRPHTHSAALPFYLKRMCRLVAPPIAHLPSLLPSPGNPPTPSHQQPPTTLFCFLMYYYDAPTQKKNPLHNTQTHIQEKQNRKKK